MTIIANLTASILIFLSALMGQPSQPASQPVADPASFSAYPFKLASTWVPETLADAGVDMPANVTFLYQNENNCGAKLSPSHMGGCTVKMVNGHYAVLISPELAYTAAGNHILFHELGHTLGMNECEAEAYAHTFEDPTKLLWSYPECGQEND